MSRTLRFLRRALGTVFVTLPLHGLQVLAGLLEPWPRFQAKVRGGILRLWSRLMGRVVGMRVRVEGTPPEPPFLLVSNHLGYADVFALGAHTGATFVAKSEIGAWPLAGWICRASGVIFVDRGTKRDLLRVAELIDEALQRGRGVILFGEGTTSRGEDILPLKPSLLQVAAAADLPVHYATLSYHTPEGELSAVDSVVWWGGEGLLPHARRFFRLSRFEARLTFGPEPVRETDRKVLARKLQAAMEAGFTPTAKPEEE